MNERPITTRPILPEWPRSITSHTANDEQSTILMDITYSHVNARENMLFVHEYSFNNMLDYGPRKIESVN